MKLLALLLKTATTLLLVAGAANAACNVKCDASDKSAVCGSDGQTAKTYQNVCLLEFAKCDNAALTLKGKGSCEEIAKKSKVHVRATIHSSDKEARTAPKTQAECDKPCTRELDQMCGSDGKTYNNKCLFEIGLCMNPNLKVTSDDACP